MSLPPIMYIYPLSPIFEFTVTASDKANTKIMNLPNVPHNHALTANAIFLNTINEYRGISHRQSEDIKKLKAEVSVY